MEQLSGFCDFCISGAVSSKELTLMLKELITRKWRLKWRTMEDNVLIDLFAVNYQNVAIEQIYDDIKTDSKEKKNDPIPEPLQLDLKEFEGKLKVFHRLTVIFKDNAVSLVLVRLNLCTATLIHRICLFVFLRISQKTFGSTTYWRLFPQQKVPCSTLVKT